MLAYAQQVSNTAYAPRVAPAVKNAPPRTALRLASN